MTTITLPADIELSLAEAARQQGITPELLAINSLRRLFIPVETAIADTTTPMSYLQMAKAFQLHGVPVPDADVEIDLDAYPLY